ncbi:hypothetical protein EPN83_00650 [Patescibacteria group bacterium]|nr:MAG: hypothetical protein EPN83_00650 [Patescibacteria group bacterium]
MYKIRIIFSRPIVLIVLLAIVVRIATVLLFSPVDPSGGDFPLFDRMAKSLLVQGDFAGEPAKTYGSPNINPGFAIFLAALYFIFGTSPVVVVGAQVILGALLAVASYLIGRELFVKRTALAAGVVTALWPPFLLQTLDYGSSVLLYTTLSIFGLFFFIRLVERGSLRSALASGAFLGFATLTKSIGFYVPLVFFIWLVGRSIVMKFTSPFLTSLEINHSQMAAAAPKGRGFLTRFKKTGLLTFLLILAYFAVLAPWTYRNFQVSDEIHKVQIVAKGELGLISPNQLSSLAKVLSKSSTLLSGLKRMYLFPYNLWLVDRDADFSYREVALKSIKERRLPQELLTVMSLKGTFTFLHWALLMLGIYALFSLSLGGWGILILLYLGYVTAAAIGFTALRTFQRASHLSSFLFPLLPILVVFASALVDRLLRNKNVLKRTTSRENNT